MLRTDGGGVGIKGFKASGKASKETMKAVQNMRENDVVQTCARTLIYAQAIYTHAASHSSQVLDGDVRRLPRDDEYVLGPCPTWSRTGGAGATAAWLPPHWSSLCGQRSTGPVFP